MGKIFFSMSNYLHSLVVIVMDKYLHFLNNPQEFLHISTERWSKQKEEIKIEL
jgi:hypothetical protein